MNVKLFFALVLLDLLFAKDKAVWNVWIPAL